MMKVKLVSMFEIKDKIKRLQKMKIYTKSGDKVEIISLYMEIECKKASISVEASSMIGLALSLYWPVMCITFTLSKETIYFLAREE
ncbi:hypothetical protein [Peribacillus sp. NPDC058075]|uniref:hypothetical protein n=1 Tax=unclassified Peribacillus TaxID=2675266 RepID=UPI0036DAB85C